MGTFATRWTMKTNRNEPQLRYWVSLKTRRNEPHMRCGNQPSVASQMANRRNASTSPKKTERKISSIGRLHGLHCFERLDGLDVPLCPSEEPPEEEQPHVQYWLRSPSHEPHVQPDNYQHEHNWCECCPSSPLTDEPFQPSHYALHRNEAPPLLSHRDM